MGELVEFEECDSLHSANCQYSGELYLIIPGEGEYIHYACKLVDGVLYLYKDSSQNYFKLMLYLGFLGYATRFATHNQEGHPLYGIEIGSGSKQLRVILKGGSFEREKLIKALWKVMRRTGNLSDDYRLSHGVELSDTQEVFGLRDGLPDTARL